LTGSARSAAARRGSEQYFVNPGLQLDYFELNTHRTLFSDVRVRQAVNYAIDRRSLARLGDWFQPLPERPTDHYLPPAMPGFRNAHVYPITPNIVKARALVRRAHAGGRTAILDTCDAYPCPQQAQIVKTDLARIGLDVQVNTLTSSKLFALEETPGKHFDLARDGQLAPYLDPQAMLSAILEDTNVGPTFTDPTYQLSRPVEKWATCAGRKVGHGGVASWVRSCLGRELGSGEATVVDEAEPVGM
jgi:peptide/nickel transport system substrate-binding protein